MANTLTPYLRTLLARGLPVLRQASIMPRLVNTDYSMQAALKGSTIDFPVPPVLTAGDVTPATTPQANSDVTPSTISMPLNNWKYVKFALTDQDMTKIDASEHFVPQSMEAAMKTLGETINASIMAVLHGAGGFFGYTGTAGTTPFASAVDGAVDVRKILNNQLAPQSPRYMVLSPDAEANALKLSAFTGYDGGGQTAEASRVTGFLGRRYGFDFYMDQQVPSHTAGTGSGYLLNGALSAGATSATVDTGSGTILVGDVVSFAGVTGTYNVETALASNVFTFYPPLPSAAADNAAVTVRATHVVNVGFHRDAIGFAARPLSGQIPGMPAIFDNSVTMQDPVSGIPLRISVNREWMQTSIAIDILYGVKVIRPELGVRLAG